MFKNARIHNPSANLLIELEECLYFLLGRPIESSSWPILHDGNTSIQESGLSSEMDCFAFGIAVFLMQQYFPSLLLHKTRLTFSSVAVLDVCPCIPLLFTVSFVITCPMEIRTQTICLPPIARLLQSRCRKFSNRKSSFWCLLVFHWPKILFNPPRILLWLNTTRSSLEKLVLDTLLSPIRALSADGRKNIFVWCLQKFYRHTRELPILLQRLLTQFVRSNESGSTSPWHFKKAIYLQNKKVFH